MNDDNITRYTEKELEQRRIKNIDTGTDWNKVNSLTDNDNDPDAAPEIDSAFWEKASFAQSTQKVDVHLKLDSEIAHFFQSEGPDYQNHINAILKTYVKARKEQ